MGKVELSRHTALDSNMGNHSVPRVVQSRVEKTDSEHQLAHSKEREENVRRE